MSQVAEKGVEQIAMDPYEIGWYIESADEETYGPVSRQALRRFLEDKTITPNTLVRHCTQPEARPAADQPVIMEQLVWKRKDRRLATGWQRHGPARSATSKPWRKARCHAPGISGLPCWCACGAMLPIATDAGPSPFASSIFLCRRCQAGMYNRRFVALLVDTGILFYVPIIVALCHSGSAWRWPVDSRGLAVNVVQSGLPLPSFSFATRSFAAPGSASE